MEGSRPRGRLKRTCREVVQKDCQAHKLNKEDAMDGGGWKIRIGERVNVSSGNGSPEVCYSFPRTKELTIYSCHIS